MRLNYIYGGELIELPYREHTAKYLKTIEVGSPRWCDDFLSMGQNLTVMLGALKAKGKHIQSVVIEVGKTTKVTYMFFPKRWGQRFSRAFPTW